MKLHVNWGHASARGPKRVTADSGGDTVVCAHDVDEVFEPCAVCRALDKAAHIPIADAPAASPFNGKLQGGLLLSEDAIALRAAGVFSKYPLLIPVRNENPEEA